MLYKRVKFFFFIVGQVLPYGRLCTSTVFNFFVVDILLYYFFD